MKKYSHQYSICLPIELLDDDFLKVEITSIVGLTELDVDLDNAKERGKNNLKRLGKSFKIGFVDGVCKKLMKLTDKELSKCKIKKEIIDIREDTKVKFDELNYKE